MLPIPIPKQELWDEEHNKFIQIDSTVLELEHSLLSMAEWESKHKKPLLDRKPHTTNELRDYVRCMTTNKIENPNVYAALTIKDLAKVQEYMADPMTATTFADAGKPKRGGQFITSELLYCWMSQFNIPYDPCQTWHLNRLLTLIKVCSEENKGEQKVPRGKAMQDQRALNEARKKALGTRG